MEHQTSGQHLVFDAYLAQALFTVPLSRDAPDHSTPVPGLQLAEAAVLALLKQRSAPPATLGRKAS